MSLAERLLEKFQDGPNAAEYGPLVAMFAGNLLSLSDEELRGMLEKAQTFLADLLYPITPDSRGGYLPCEYCEGAGRTFDGG